MNMLSGNIEYYKEDKTTYSTHGHHWSRKQCSKEIRKLHSKGFKPNAVALTKYAKSKVTIVGFIEIPAEGLQFYSETPNLIRAKTQSNFLSLYRPDELTLVDTNTGELTC